MKIKQITYKRLAKLADYENHSLEITTELSENENNTSDVDNAIKAMMDKADEFLGEI